MTNIVCVDVRKFKCFLAIFVCSTCSVIGSGHSALGEHLFLSADIVCPTFKLNEGVSIPSVSCLIKPSLPDHFGVKGLICLASSSFVHVSIFYFFISIKSNKITF